MTGQLKSMVSFTSTKNTPWWGVTVQHENVVDKVMFTDKANAEGWLLGMKFRKPKAGWPWTQSDRDLSTSFRRDI